MSELDFTPLWGAIGPAVMFVYLTWLDARAAREAEEERDAERAVGPGKGTP